MMMERLDRVNLTAGGGVDAHGWKIRMEFVPAALTVNVAFEDRGWFIARRTGRIAHGRELVEVNLDDQDTGRDLPDDHDCWDEGCVPGRHVGRTQHGTCLNCGGCGRGDCCGPCPDECRSPVPWRVRRRHGTYRIPAPAV